MLKKEYLIDDELSKVMPILTAEEKQELEDSLLKDGFKGAPVMVWRDIIIDGHNRYELCQKHNIPFEVKEMDFSDKAEVIQWMIRAQLGRRNLNKAQRIDLVRKFRPELEKKARENRLSGLKQNQAQTVLQNSSERKTIDVRGELAKAAGVSTDTYSKGEKILNSEYEELKEQILSDKKSINAGYKEWQCLEKQGHHIDIPASKVEEPREEAPTITNADVGTRLQKILTSYENNVLPLFTELGWLVKMEYISVDGDDLTKKIRAKLSAHSENIRELQQLISTMQPDDCGCDDVIIVKK